MSGDEHMNEAGTVSSPRTVREAMTLNGVTPSEPPPEVLDAIARLASRREQEVRAGRFGEGQS